METVRDEELGPGEESPTCPPEPQLEMSQDLELLAQEIAEAAVEEDKASSQSSRSASPQSPPPTILEQQPDDITDDRHSEEEEEKEQDPRDSLETTDATTTKDDLHEDTIVADKPRSQSPVDETSWVLVEAEEEGEGRLEGDAEVGEEQMTQDNNRYSLLRKFLASGDLAQKLVDAGLVCEETTSERENELVSSSSSMIICDIPQTEDNLDPNLLLKNLGDCDQTSHWSGVFHGARVEMEVERKGGLQVVAVKVWQQDLLSALSSLQQLVSTTGLVSYADVDVTSLLARAA